MRTADCVVGGFRYASAGQAVDSLLLGLYDDGLLHHVGFSSTFSQQEKLNLLQIVEPLIEPPGFEQPARRARGIGAPITRASGSL